MSRTRPNRAERLRQNTAAALLLLGAAVAAFTGGGLASWLSGDGWQPTYAYPTLRGFGELIRNVPGASLWTVHTSTGSLWLIVGCTAVISFLWVRLLVMPLLRPGADPRRKALGQWSAIRSHLSANAVRHAGRYTRPDLTRWQRWLPGRRVPLTEFGYRIGRYKGTRHDLWADFEKRVRVIARTGWGKTSRLLVRAAREVPGAALIGSTKADLFEQTVRARQRGVRLSRAWWPFTRGLVRSARWPFTRGEDRSARWPFTGGRRPWRWHPNPAWRPLLDGRAPWNWRLNRLVLDNWAAGTSTELPILAWRPWADGRAPWNWRRNRAWRPLTRSWWRPQYGPARRVLVVDFSERVHRYAAGFERVTWNPLIGCEDWEVALRRGRALVAGAEDGDRSDEQDGFFRNSAGQVISAWFHAAALHGHPIAEVVRWQQNIDLPDPKDILRQHPAAAKAALLALDKHLDKRAERTTSSVERFVLLALAPFATPDGEEFATGPSVSIPALIREQATIYLLASDTTAAAVAPLLTLFADEWFHAGRAVAIAQPSRRLPVPAVGILDELRLLTPIPSLPQVVYEMRAYGVGVIYALQNAAQEVELYGEAAESLAANVQVTIVGGYDGGLVDELIAQVPEVAVASPSVAGNLLDAPEFSESTAWRKGLTAADLQQLGDGEALVRLAGATPFFASFPSFRDNRRLRRTITAEERNVRGRVAMAQALAAAERDARLRTARAAYARTHA